MKYIIDVPDTEGHYDNEYEMVTMRVHYGSIIIDMSMDAKPYTEPNRKDVENEVWEFVRSCLVMECSDFVEAFDSCSYINLLEHSYQEAKAKYEAWLKQKDEIHVGDEVTDTKGYKGIATYIKCELCDVLWDDGSVTEDNDKKEFTKTGRHFSEVAELLEKMRGNEEE